MDGIIGKLRVGNQVHVFKAYDHHGMYLGQ